MNWKKILKKLISLTGYTIIHKNFRIAETRPVQRTMYIALQHLKDLNYEVDTIVDVGAASGTDPLLSSFPNAKFILIEPLTEFLPKLELLKENYKIQKIITAAVGTQLTDIAINVHPDLYGSSLFKESDGSFADGIPRVINMIKLKNEINHLNPENNNILKVDVQGAELDVLQSAEELLSLFDVIILEVSFFNFLIGSPDFSDVIKYMADRNYVIYDMFDFHLRPIDNALAQVDILFVKRDGKFRTTHSYAGEETRRQRNLL